MDEISCCVTNLGRLIGDGDVVLGNELRSAVLSGTSEWSAKNDLGSIHDTPDVVLVIKVRGDGAGGSRTASVRQQLSAPAEEDDDDDRRRPCAGPSGGVRK